jgi:hypothetical protein
MHWLAFLVGQCGKDRMSIQTLDQLCDYVERSLDRAESEEWCVLTLLADADTHALIADLIDARDCRNAARECNTANAALTGGEAVPSNGVVVGFDHCCGHPPKVTEWRPGCYGAQCMECGGIVGDERQLDRNELMEEWNRTMWKRTANNMITVSGVDIKDKP